MARKIKGMANLFRSSGLTSFIWRVGQIFVSGPQAIVRALSSALKSFIYLLWPKDSRRRYRTVLIAVFLFAFLAANLDYPKYWNKTADWFNPKLESVNTPDAIARYDKWGIGRNIDNAFRMPHFWDIPFSQGLDLRGGIHLIYKADLSDVPKSDYGESMNGLRDTIERRVNLFGVREPQVLVEKSGDGYRLIVELAGIQDFNTAIQLIGQTPFLEFKEERSFDEQKRVIELVTEDNLTDEQIRSVCKNVSAELILAVTQQTGEDPCFKQIAPAPLTGKYVDSASVQLDPSTNQTIVELQLDGEGAKLFEEITERNINKRLAIYLDGILRSAPVVQDRIAGGKAQITGINIQEAKQISRDLNAGALPVPISLISQQSIGASLGEQSLSDSLRAGIFGALAVVIFMIMLYRLSGFLAVISLAIYISLFLAILKLIPVTLTLPGIAGLILSIGMAVDANILVFERLREEMSKEKESPAGQSGAGSSGNNFTLILNHAYERAWSSIRDGNISTLLTAIILFWFSTSFIKGFALTLGIGIAVSMFSAMIVTKYLMRFIGEGRLGRKINIWIR